MQHNLELIFKQCINQGRLLNIVIANGEPPKNPFLHQLLKQANCIVCCDGAITTLELINLIPSHIVGDCDSLSFTQKEKYKDIIKCIPDQNSNDLTKAINFAIDELHLDDIIILGATGMREDHSLANISLLVEYTQKVKNIVMISDYGFFRVYNKKTVVPTVIGQQVSIFAPLSTTKVTTHGLKWDLKGLVLPSWHDKGTLNEALHENFELNIDQPVLVYQTF